MEDMEISGRILQHDMRELFTTVMNRLCADLALHLKAWYISRETILETITLSLICNISLTLPLSLVYTKGLCLLGVHILRQVPLVSIWGSHVGCSV